MSMNDDLNHDLLHRIWLRNREACDQGRILEAEGWGELYDLLVLPITHWRDNETT